MIPVYFNNTNASSIIIEKIFLANSVVPLAIQKDENDDKIYKILTKMTENISNTDIHFEFRIKIQNAVDKSYIESRSLYIDQLKKDEKKFKAFKEIMKDFDPAKFYIGDLRFNTANRNYYIESFRQLIGANNKIYYEKNKIYIPRSMFIALSLYLESLLDPYNEQEKEFLFISQEINNMRFEKVEGVKLIASTKKELENGDFSYNTHYEMNCGPSMWKFNYEVITPEDLELIEPLAGSIFDAEYSQYNEKFIGVVPNGKGSVYVLTTNDQDRIVALVVNDNLIKNKTNLIDPYKIFKTDLDELEEENKEEGDKE
jgi:hypothetical protein